MVTDAGVGRWTRYFAVASALSMVLLQVSRLLGATVYTRALIGLFGAVLPMIFGMAYLLLPSYAGRTLATPSAPVIHLVVAYVGTGILVVDSVFGIADWILALGVGFWSFGIVLFIATLTYTVGPALVSNSTVVTRSSDRPQRSTRLATAMIPVALGYLLVGTYTLVSTTYNLPAVFGGGLPAAIHYYGVGAAMLLIFALGIRLLTGFFHVAPPRYVSWVVLFTGGLGPALLVPNLWTDPWFTVGAAFLVVAMVGYGTLVAIVGYQTTRHRVGLTGIGLGAVAGVLGVSVAGLLTAGQLDTAVVPLHTTLVLDGFLLLTIIGYAYQFFPVTSGRFRGASRQTAVGTVLFLGAGIGIEVVGTVVSVDPIIVAGAILTLSGTSGYAYLLIRRFTH